MFWNKSRTYAVGGVDAISAGGSFVSAFLAEIRRFSGPYVEISFETCRLAVEEMSIKCRANVDWM
jgi:hypothetical protein